MCLILIWFIAKLLTVRSIILGTLFGVQRQKMPKDNLFQNINCNIIVIEAITWNISRLKTVLVNQ